MATRVWVLPWRRNINHQHPAPRCQGREDSPEEVISVKVDFLLLHIQFLIPNMAPQTQKALVVAEIGKPLTLVTDRPVPQPEPDQVQVRVTIAGPNPHDQKARDRGLFIANLLPAVLTNDVVGRVTALGSNVTRFSIGDRVVGQPTIGPGTPQTGLQEYVVLDTDFINKIPDGFTDDDAATLPTNTLAPLVALFDASGFGIPAPWTSAASTFDYKGTTVLVVGGGSNCGRYGVQFAALAGIGRIVVVGGDEA